MTEANPKRRWFRFSLRTLFVLQALLAVGWTAYQLNWIRQRHEFLTKNHPHCKDGIAPLPLRFFGETGKSFMALEAGQDFDLNSKRLFPEAFIIID